MQFSRLTLIFLALSSAVNLCAQEKAAPKSEPAKAESTASDQSAAKPSGPAVDDVKMTNSTFESPYFKFTYDLPTGWKTLDDATRKAANQLAMREDIDRARATVVSPRKAAAKGPATATTNPQPQPQSKPVVPERFSLMAASPTGLDSLASPLLPRINIWAHRRLPPLDKPLDHAQLLISGKHNEVLVRPQELIVAGRQFARIELINAAGNYQARYVTAIGDYLIGFDFLTKSEREMAEFSNSIKSVKFE
jgi:hypothetical protein